MDITTIQKSSEKDWGAITGNDKQHNFLSAVNICVKSEGYINIHFMTLNCINIFYILIYANLLCNEHWKFLKIIDSDFVTERRPISQFPLPLLILKWLMNNNNFQIQDYTVNNGVINWPIGQIQLIDGFWK